MDNNQIQSSIISIYQTTKDQEIIMEEEILSNEISPIMEEKTTTTTTNSNSTAFTKGIFNFARSRKMMVIVLILGVAFFVLYYYDSCTNFGEFLPSLSPFSSSRDVSVNDKHYEELRKVLEAASTKEKIVILTTLNEAWATPNSIFDIFLESFRIGNNTSWLLNHLVVISVDENAYIRCQKLVQHCYFFETKKSHEMGNEARFMSPIYMEMMWERLALLQTILKLGYNFVFTDTDIMWFRNPLPHFSTDSDFQTSCDNFNGMEFDIRNSPNNGFLFVRSNHRTINFYKFWVNSRRTYPQLNEQDVFNRIKDKPHVKRLGVKLRFLDTNYFGGFCQKSKDFDKVCTMHANCCVGLHNKIADLNITLEDWKTYFTSNHTTPKPTQWRVPKECHM